MSLVVAVAEGLTADDVARAVEAGPPHVAAQPGYPALLDEAGFVGIEIADLSDDYESTLAASVGVRDENRAGLEALVGVDTFEEGQSDRRQELAAVREGLLRRHLISAVRP
jgi:hypothetical protein